MEEGRVLMECFNWRCRSQQDRRTDKKTFGKKKRFMHCWLFAMKILLNFPKLFSLFSSPLCWKLDYIIAPVWTCTWYAMHNCIVDFSSAIFKSRFVEHVCWKNSLLCSSLGIPDNSVWSLVRKKLGYSDGADNHVTVIIVKVVPICSST